MKYVIAIIGAVVSTTAFAQSPPIDVKAKVCMSVEDVSALLAKATFDGRRQGLADAQQAQLAQRSDAVMKSIMDQAKPKTDIEREKEQREKEKFAPAAKTSDSKPIPPTKSAQETIQPKNEYKPVETPADYHLRHRKHQQ